MKAEMGRFVRESEELLDRLVAARRSAAAAGDNNLVERIDEVFDRAAYRKARRVNKWCGPPSRR